jgi:hypothetical protein
MRVPREQELLDLWERAAERPLAFRALALLAAAHPALSWQELEALSVGERDRRLLRLRAQLFGANAELRARCPGCGEQVEGMLPLQAIGDGMASSEAHESTLEVDHHQVCFRPPAAGDLLAIAHCPPEKARARLLERCVQSAYGPESQALSVHALPPAVLDAVIGAMEKADANAWLEVELTCAACGHSWPMAFDIARYLWRELTRWAGRTLLDVHRLARAYGWTEAETLALSATRRQIYLELIAA